MTSEPASCRTAPPPVATLLALLLTAWAGLATPSDGARGPAEGQPILVSGLVTDTVGEPISSLEVRLYARRNAFNLRKLGREDRGETSVAARTDAEGRFELYWRWHDFYNSFDLTVGLEIREAATTRWHELARQDLTERIRGDGPVTVAFTLENSEALRTYRDFLAGVRSEDQRRVYGEMGKPGRVDRLQKAEHEEETWWYFQLGRAYRFEDGRLQEVVDFEPVRSF